MKNLDKNTIGINKKMLGEKITNFYCMDCLASYLDTTVDELLEKIEEFKAKGAPVKDGAFGENLIVQGFDFKTLPVGTRLKCNDVILEITQIGKQCHNGCEIFKIMGDCIMPREGVFARVIKGGVISEGDEMVYA